MLVHLSALGCRLNEAELELWSQQFQVAGFDISSDPHKADLLVFNSCAVTQEAVRKSRQQINRLRRNNPHAKVVVSGCFVSLNANSESSRSSASPKATATTADPPGKSENPHSTPSADPEGVDLLIPNAHKDELVPLIINEWFGDLAVEALPQHPASTDLLSDETPRSDSSSDGQNRHRSPPPDSITSAVTSANRANNGLKSIDLAESRKFPIIPILATGSAAATAASGLGSDIDNPASKQTFSRSRQRAFIKIQDGCRYKCTYCIVTVARGEERSRPIRELVAEVRQLQQQGIQEIVLTGVHVGGYGSDTGESLANLLQALLNDTAIPRIRFASVEPWDLEDHLLSVLQHSRVMPHMHLPVQSGCDSVLKRMARRCKTDDFQSLANGLRQSMPDFNVTTDIIVGFPGETDSEWQDTLRFVENTGFGHIHIFPFSPRQGTHAATLANQVNGTVRKQRTRQLKQLADSSRQDFLSRFSGRTMDVLWESAKLLGSGSKGLEQETAASASAHVGEARPARQRYQGYTPNYLRVFIDTDEPTGSGESLENRILPTQLNDIAFVTGGATANAMLRGTLT